MVERDKIVKFCENYLQIKDFDDYCVNGLQIEGAQKVGRIVTGVTLSKKLIEAAIEKKAQMIAVHHGVFSKHIGNPPQIGGYVRNRIKLLLANDISLLGFHLPLDAHPIIGNNAAICQLLGVRELKTCYVGFVGNLKKPVDINTFVGIINEKLGTNSYTILAGRKKVRRIGVISGGASPNLMSAVSMGADTFICGDVRESTVRAVEENGINFINAGHYNTEKLGIQNLGRLIVDRFKIKAEYVDIPNDI